MRIIVNKKCARKNSDILLEVNVDKSMGHMTNILRTDHKCIQDGSCSDCIFSKITAEGIGVILKNYFADDNGKIEISIAKENFIEIL